MKTEKYFNEYSTVVFKTIQVLFVLLAIAEAACHHWLGVSSNLIMCMALEICIGAGHQLNKRIAIICMFVDVTKPDETKPEAEQDKDSLVGRTIVEAGKCDTCPNRAIRLQETHPCRRLSHLRKVIINQLKSFFV